ncbi:hypothetical protein [Mesorhizobium retamae]|uniref:Transposase n=1 Tax=Mesorhizobium retamae TaxID=2912854 RepID=A0ABS9QLU5_9HYPH|nr:hypothetical protein [Mesorhizobium sp. IRAMC:0171]MCG7508418.1 hypothetical protein [Mesorhizobium sp. IRAMC:0171]
MKLKNRGSILKPVISKPQPPMPEWKARALERGEMVRQSRTGRSPQRRWAYRARETPPASIAFRARPSSHMATQLVATIGALLLATLRPL